MKTVVKPIKMVCWMNEEGQVTPIRFKIATEDGDKVFSIMSTHNIEQTRVAGNRVYRYECYVDINGTARACEIRYEVDSCKWVLFKI